MAGDGDGMVVARAPGRVNLIGDHTDHQDGFVLPLAIDRSATVRARRRPDRRIRLHSEQLGPGHADLDQPVPDGSWIDHVAAVAAAWEEATGARLAGIDGTLDSSVPVGGGLSSSAAVAVASLRALVAAAGHRWDPVLAAEAAQRGEQRAVGTQVGIMDPLVVAAAEAGCALLIDCATLERSAHRLPGDLAVVVLDTGTRRQLATSAYNDRRASCQAAAAALGRTSLRQVTDPAEVDRLADPVLRRRARHVVTENQRVLAAAAALDEGNSAAVGALMAASHRSLRDDFEVSGPELEAMVAAAAAAPGCHGARLTGAGFAGCAVALVQRSSLGAFMADVVDRYRRATSLVPDVWPTAAVSGVELLAG